MNLSSKKDHLIRIKKLQENKFNNENAFLKTIREEEMNLATKKIDSDTDYKLKQLDLKKAQDENIHRIHMQRLQNENLKNIYPHVIEQATKQKFIRDNLKSIKQLITYRNKIKKSKEETHRYETLVTNMLKGQILSDDLVSSREEEEEGEGEGEEFENDILESSLNISSCNIFDIEDTDESIDHQKTLGTYLGDELAGEITLPSLKFHEGLHLIDENQGNKYVQTASNKVVQTSEQRNTLNVTRKDFNLFHNIFYDDMKKSGGY
jgi:hypothetical protein